VTLQHNKLCLVSRYEERPSPQRIYCRWSVVGPPYGAVQYVEFRYPSDSTAYKILSESGLVTDRRWAVDLGYHAVEPQYEGQPSMDCDVLEGRCFYDGSTRAAEGGREVFDEGGEERLYAYLKDYFHKRFLPEDE